MQDKEILCAFFGFLDLVRKSEAHVNPSWERALAPDHWRRPRRPAAAARGRDAAKPETTGSRGGQGGGRAVVVGSGPVPGASWSQRSALLLQLLRRLEATVPEAPESFCNWFGRRRAAGRDEHPANDGVPGHRSRSARAAADARAARTQENGGVGIGGLGALLAPTPTRE